MRLPYIDIEPRCNCGHSQSDHWLDGTCRSRACECGHFVGQTYPPYADLDPADVCDCEACLRSQRKETT